MEGLEVKKALCFLFKKEIYNFTPFWIIINTPHVWKVLKAFRVNESLQRKNYNQDVYETSRSFDINLTSILWFCTEFKALKCNQV